MHFKDDTQSVGDRKVEMEGILESYGPEDIWVPYTVEAFWQDGGVLVKIKFENEY